MLGHYFILSNEAALSGNARWIGLQEIFDFYFVGRINKKEVTLTDRSLPSEMLSFLNVLFRRRNRRQ